MVDRCSLVFICFSLASCATLVNNKLTSVEIHSNAPSAVICLDNDSCFAPPLILQVPRSYQDFAIVIKNDSVQQAIKVRSHVSPEFKWGNLLFLYLSPIAYIIDASSREKLFSYDNSILVFAGDKSGYYKKWKPSGKGQLHFRYLLPWFDFMDFRNGRTFDHYNAYMGLTIGLDYYHSKRSFISLSGGATGLSDIAVPVGDRFYSTDTVKRVQSFSAKLTNNHDIGVFSSANIGFTIGYGLSITHFTYREIF